MAQIVLDEPGHGNHQSLVNDITERYEFYRDQRMDIVKSSLEDWDLYLTRKREFRKKGEEWRANLALPDAFANIEAKVANMVSILTSADPMVQPEGVFDKDMDTAKAVERLLDYAYRKNEFIKLLIKMARMRQVVGTVFWKLTWANETHKFTFSRSPEAVQEFQMRLHEALQNPQIQHQPPDWLSQPEEFEKWRRMANMAFGMNIPAPPLDGEQTLIKYRGPKIHLLPFTSVYVDPLNDEMRTQNFCIYKTVKPESWLLDQVQKGRYDAEAVAYAMESWDGQVKEEEEVELAIKMGIQNADPSGSSDPYYRKGVDLKEVWQPGSDVPYALMLNERAIINKNVGEMPFMHGQIGIGAARNTVVPGHFYGLSDLRPTRDVFWEKRKLRNLRVDGATLNILPAYTKLKEVGLPEMMHHIRPGAMIPVSRKDAVNPLHKDALPPEAYREPAELDADIADSMGVYASTKGAPATIGRVTGTEFQGRENRAQIRFKLETMFFEEDLAPTAQQMLAMYAQFGDDPFRIKVGGSPDPFVKLSRNDLMESMETQWRFRGANKAINRDMQVQQLLMWTKAFGAQLTPQEFRYAAKLILDILDIRGATRLVTDEGTMQKTQEYQMMMAAQGMGGPPQGNPEGEEAPAEADPDEQAAMSGPSEGA